MNEYNRKISALPGASFLQTDQWAAIKARIGWIHHHLEIPAPNGEGLSAAMSILEKPIRLGPIPTGHCFLYVPRGPLMDWADESLRNRALDMLRSFGKERHAIFIKIDPDVPFAFGEPSSAESRPNPAGESLLEYYRTHGWEYSPQQIQFENSVWIDLRPDEETLLSNMKQRTRYKVRLAAKKGVTVRLGDPNDFPMLIKMYGETASRDGFLIRPADYYMDVWQRFHDEGMLYPLIAEVDGEPCAAVMVFITGNTARYVYGMSANIHREKMPNYLLQWEAMRLAKSKGCDIYDLWGAPDTFNESDRMWGVYQFKRGLGGEVVITPGAWDLPLMKGRYHLFIRVLPKLVALLKRRNHNAESN